MNLKSIKILKKPQKYRHKNNLETTHAEILKFLEKNSKPWSIEMRLLHLGEEVGELFDIFLQYKGAKDRKQTLKDLSIALNDVVFEVFAIYHFLGIDLNESLLDEFKKTR